jgi:hypothetical protein
VVTVFGDVQFVVNYVGPIVGFLGTGPGVLLSVTLAVLLLWSSSSSRTRRQPASEPGRGALLSRFYRERHRQKLVKQEGKQEHQRLKSALREAEQELKRLKAELLEDERERELLKAKLLKGERERELLRAELLEDEQQREGLRSRLQECLEEHERERQRLESEIEELGAERDALKEKVTSYESRLTLKRALNSAYVEGLHLRARTSNHRRRRTSRTRRPKDEAAAKKWAIRTSELIKEALGEGEARHFLGVEGFGSDDSSLAREQKQLDEHLKRLSELIERVDSLEPLELRASFKEQELADSR